MVLEDSSSSGEEEEHDDDFNTILGMISMIMCGGRGDDHNLATYTSTVIERRAMPRSWNITLIKTQPIQRSTSTDAFGCTHVFL